MSGLQNFCVCAEGSLHCTTSADAVTLLFEATADSEDRGDHIHQIVIALVVSAVCVCWDEQCQHRHGMSVVWYAQLQETVCVGGDRAIGVEMT